MDNTTRSITNREWIQALGEFAVLAGLFVADARGLIIFSKTPYLLLLAWLSLRTRSLRWRDVGFTRPERWAGTVLWGVAAGLAIELFALFVTEPAFSAVLGSHPDLSDFRALEGNLGATVLMTLILWPVAAFGEEMVYRGYLLNRLAGLMGEGGKRGAIGALLLSSAVFGASHLDQGITGWVQEAWSGLVLGLFYLACGRKLAPVIVAHGTSNTLAFVLIYLGWYPGT